MKILQLGKFYPIRGGVEKVMFDLVEGLSERGVFCDMLCASTEDFPAGNIRLNAYGKIMVVPTKVKLAATMLSPAMILRLRKIAKHYDIIHIHHPDPMACLALFLSGYRGKIILHWHADILKQKTLLKLYMPLQNWLTRRADIIVGTSPVYVAESPFLQKAQHKVDFIPIGVSELTSSEDKVSTIRRRYKSKTLIFSVGRLVDYKGYTYLIESAKYLDENYHIIIGGKGPLWEMLENQIREQGVEDRVSLLGFVSEEELGNYYQAADIFCLSSVWKSEAFAIVQIEAMSFGKPVVSTRIAGSGVSWVNAYGVSGLTVPPQDPEALASAFQAIIDNPMVLDCLSRGSRSRYEALFTRDKMVSKSLDLYSRMSIK